MEWFIAAVIVAALGVAAMAAAGGLGEMRMEPVRDYYRQDLPADRPLTGAEVDQVRFAVTLRGYSMAQVDDLLERLAAEISVRDERIRELTGDAANELPEDQIDDTLDRSLPLYEPPSQRRYAQVDGEQSAYAPSETLDGDGAR